MRGARRGAPTTELDGRGAISSCEDPRRMRSRLHGGIPGGEETAPPPPGMDASGNWDGGGRTPMVPPWLSAGEHGLAATAKPQPERLLPFPGAPGSARHRLREPAPIHSSPSPRPSAARRGHWHSPGPIAASPLRPRHQCAPAGGGASPMSLRLLPGPRDPFCLGRAKLGLSSRHFREEAFPPPSGLSLAWGWGPSRPGFCNFPSSGWFPGRTGRVLRALTLLV